ncbi:MAG: RNA-binding transcriptional accessory protein [Desulfobacteraceae bacterium]|nr:RNA-binding transcriptional accessory protein [Desulfobacteraceae bacterium]MBC2753717.1 RNA-binding transcriptional accessory protein [Desulfobacteraceae bacterium]
MNESHMITITRELNLNLAQVSAVADLLADGATIPFIARYRKEATGSLDEVVVAQVRDRLEQLAELQKRREAILKSLEENGHLTDTLQEAVQNAASLSKLEDIYLPYRPKRRTRATMAREKGLAPLADLIFAQNRCAPVAAAQAYIDVEKQVNTAEEALAGARDIIAEWVAEDSKAREKMRNLFASRSTLQTRVATGKEAEGIKYRDYFEWEEPAATAPSHRILAMRRGERDDILNLTVAPPEEDALTLLETQFVTGDGDDAEQVRAAVHDSYRRLLSRAMETELRLALKERADTEAIRVFADNLRELLMASPLGSKRTLAIDPGYRTGGKLVCLDRQGKLLHNDTVFIIGSEARAKQASEKIHEAVKQYRIEAIAVGNGTASRETESFLKNIGLPSEIPIVMVNESGASIYSASDVAREEFPDHDITVRGAVSIGRRLMDPLSELVKIDPKSIGVGQYQHDVDQTALKKTLDDTVVSCVNGVGVDLNRASRELLTYVSGLGPALAQNIVQFRDANGSFKTRKQLREVPRLGPKAFEQCAGFLRINGGPQPLDASAVHPESYPVVDTMTADLDCTVEDLMKDEALRRQIDLSRYVTNAIGLPTLKDIMEELSKPGRDPRDPFESFAFADGIEDIKHLRTGMQLPGIVTNVTRFGAFVDIGVHQDGLVHISQLADRFVKDPAHVVKVNQKVTVTVLEVDLDRKRIALSMKRKQTSNGARPKRKAKPPKTPPREAPQKAADRPFNNPFADLLKP